MNTLNKHLPLQLLLLFAVWQNAAFAAVPDNATATAPSQKATTAAIATPVDNTKCPCNFSEEQVRTQFTYLSKGKNSCTLSNAIIRQPAKPPLPKAKTSMVLQSQGTNLQNDPVDVVWAVTFRSEPLNDINGKIVDICAISSTSKVTTSDLTNDQQVQSCFNDLEHAASLLGLTCEDKSP